MPKTKVKEFKSLTFNLGYKTLHVKCRECGNAMRRTQSGWCCDGPRLCGRLVEYLEVAERENAELRREFVLGMASVS